VRRPFPWASWLPVPAGRLAVRTLLIASAAAVLLQVVLLGSGAGRSAWVDGGRVVAVGTACALCLLRAGLVRTDRRAWAALGLGLTGWTFNAGHWMVDGPRTDRLPTLLDGMPLLFFLGALACLHLLLRARSARPAPYGLAADAVVGLLAAGAASAALVGPQLSRIGGTVPGAVTLAYVVLDVALAFSLLMAMSASGFHERAWTALVAGLGLYLAVDVEYIVAASLGRYQIGSWHGLGWSAGLAALGAAAWLHPVRVRQLRLRPWTVLAVPVLAIVVSLAVLAADGYGDAYPAATYLAVASIALATLRGVTAVRRSLLVDASVQDAVTDELTGLANRRKLLSRLDAASAGAAPHALVLLDLNHFKEINDTLGHPVGDELLRRLGPRLAGTARQSETVARLGGDEFAVLLPGVATEADALRAADRVLAGLLGAFVIDGLTLFVTASAGVALAPRHGTDGPTLLRCADVAMYQAKRSGGGAAVYRPLADPHSRSRLGAATELKRAIAEGDIVCFYQPQVDVATGVPVGVEALVRWSDPWRGLVPPEEFLGLAEQTGLMPALSDAVLRSALADVRIWRRATPHLRVAVNLSTGSLLDSRLPDRIGAALAAAGLPADALALEIADGAPADAGRARATLERLHEMGICVALDDYGTGRSSVVLLRQLPVDQLKLDGGLIEAVVSDRRARAIVRHTVLMAHALQMQVVAKGVEDAATLELVDELGCDHAQGFLLAEPMPAAALTAWLATRPAPVHG
jgi:diguanylate cyclase (GGDEF)-like protein